MKINQNVSWIKNSANFLEVYQSNDIDKFLKDFSKKIEYHSSGFCIYSYLRELYYLENIDSPGGKIQRDLDNLLWPNNSDRLYFSDLIESYSSPNGNNIGKLKLTKIGILSGIPYMTAEIIDSDTNYLPYMLYILYSRKKGFFQYTPLKGNLVYLIESGNSQGRVMLPIKKGYLNFRDKLDDPSFNIRMQRDGNEVWWNNLPENYVLRQLAPEVLEKINETTNFDENYWDYNIKNILEVYGLENIMDKLEIDYEGCLEELKENLGIRE